MNPEISRRFAWALRHRKAPMPFEVMVELSDTDISFDELPDWAKQYILSVEAEFGQNPAHAGLYGVAKSLNKYSDDQPRDELGRFGSGGGGVSAISYDPHAKIYSNGHIDYAIKNPEQVGVAFSEDTMARENAETYQNLQVTPEQQEAFANYQTKTFYPINYALRKGEMPEKYVADIKHMDKVITDAPLRDSGMQMTYFKGVDATVIEGLQPGDTIVDQGYTSVTTSRDSAAEMGYEATMRVVEYVGEKAPAVWMDAASNTGWATQNELVYGRGTPFIYVGHDEQRNEHVFVVGKYE